MFTNKREYFSNEEEFFVADGIYRGYGNVKVSYTASELNNDPHGTRENYNNAFTDYRKGVENAFGRVQMWFAILGNNKSKWDYNRHTLTLAVHASTRLHNWMLHERGLNYDPTTDPSYLFTAAW